MFKTDGSKCELAFGAEIFALWGNGSFALGERVSVSMIVQNYRFLKLRF